MGRSSTGGDDAKCPSPVGIVRPNGVRRPYELNRLELNLRSCHRPDCLVGLRLEARLWQLIEDPRLDPLSKVPLVAQPVQKT